MKWGHVLRGTPHPAPVGRPDYYKRELHASLFIRSAESLPVRSFLSDNRVDANPRDAATDCFRQHGVYPLNFSYPTLHANSSSSHLRPQFLSTTYPGEAHSYTNWEEYLNEYRGSHFALSTKKGGWDTFRHLEILFAGAIPLMPSLANSPTFSLAHYPKRTLSSILRSLMSDGPALPDEATHDYLSRWAHEHLTTKSMAEYVLETATIRGNVLFLDRALHARTDYLSAFTFIGLSEVLGSSIQAAWEPSYLFDDFDGDTLRLYGKGFGYTQSIPARLKSGSSMSESASIKDVLDLSRSADSIVVGNYDANRELVAQLLEGGIPAHRFTCVLGSDLPPDYSLMRGIAKSGMTFFVREFAR